MKKFKKLLGPRLFLELPKKEEGKLIVDENTKEALEREMMQKLQRLKVNAIGDGVTDIAVGDEVLVEASAISKAPIIPMEEDNLLLVSRFDIILVW